MKFLSTTVIDSAVSVEVDGTTYDVPRMTRDDWAEREKQQRLETIDLATQGMKPEQRARFVAYFEPECPDANALLRWAVSPAGIAWVLKRQFDAVEMPEEAQATIFRHSMAKQRHLANMLCDADEMIERNDEDAGQNRGAGPLDVPPPASND